MGTFHDESIVTEASPGAALACHTDARLERKHGSRWRASFDQHYALQADGAQTVRTPVRCAVPYSLKQLARPMTGFNVQRTMTKCLRSLAAMAEAGEV